MLCKILSNQWIAPELYDLTLESAALRESCLPGQFVHIRCGEGQLLRRPISICDKTAEGIRLLYQVKGAGTSWLSGRKAGETLDLLGPLGNGFDLGDCSQRAVFVGGGIGAFPLLLPVKQFLKTADVLLGAQSKAALALLPDFERAAASVAVATDDGSLGLRGFVTELLARRIAAGPLDAVYACGPEGMLRAVAALAEQNKIPCQLSTEARMSCGIGACLGCAIKVRREDGTETYQHVCKDGPVFDSRVLVFE